MSDGAVVLASGGQDSTTCLAWAIDKYGKEQIYPIAFDYGQRHKVELEQGRKICSILDVREPVLVPVPALSQFGAAALTNPSIEVEAKASEESSNQFAWSHDLPSTFVPGRNLIFLGLAVAYGAQQGIYDLVTGVCEADAAGYPDCRASFIAAMADAASYALDDAVNIYTPLIEINKAQTFKLAQELGVLDIILEHTHTCYEGDRSVRYEWGFGCGTCPACMERAKGYWEFTSGVIA